MNLPASVLTKNQKKKFERVYSADRRTYKMIVTIRYDDECGNGHNSFSVTADIYVKTVSGGWRDDGGGACHDEIVKRFPKLAKYVKWHLVSSDGPMHYLQNVTYLAGDRDCWGYRKGEQKRSRKNGKLLWDTEYIAKAHGYIEGDTPPDPRDIIRLVPVVGEGKERELDAARNVAVWPEATDEQLSLPKAELTELLKARLPELMDRFKADVEELGFQY